MLVLPFYKFQGTGNDFIILDAYHQAAPELSEKQIRKLCDRHFGIGADGLMYLRKKEGYDFEMDYYNADGKRSTMCGNGGRCLVKFAQHIGINKSEYSFLAIDGPHQATVEFDGQVRLRMQDVQDINHQGTYAILNTGSPHFVKFASQVRDIDVLESGRSIRYSKQFEVEGINVNFVETLGEDRIYVRTYERGVEDETLSCGTGVTASALLSAHNDHGFNTVTVKTPGGTLSVEFDKLDENRFTNIWLCGPAELVFQGSIAI